MLFRLDKVAMSPQSFKINSFKYFSVSKQKNESVLSKQYCQATGTEADISEYLSLLFFLKKFILEK